MMHAGRNTIAILLPRFGGGGAERVSVELAKALSANNCPVEIWATRFDAGRRESLEAVGIATASPRDIAGKVRHRSQAATDAVARLVGERGIGVLIVAVSPLGDMRRLKALIGNQCHLVFHLHGQPFWETLQFTAAPDTPRSPGAIARRCLSYLKKDLKEKLFHTYTRRARKLYTDTYEACDLYVVLCEAYRRDLERRLGIQPEASKVRAIYNPFEGPDNLPDTAIKEREVITVGRLTYADKRIDRLLRIWQKAARPGWKLRIVGDGPERMNLERLAKSLQLKNVYFEGYRAPDEYYRHAAIYANTSTFEGWGTSIMEALAAGCRPIAFACSAGIEGQLADGRGTLVAPFDEDEYAYRLGALMDSCPTPPASALSWLSQFTPASVAKQWLRTLAALSSN